MSEGAWNKCADGVKALLDTAFTSITATGMDGIPADSIVIRRVPRIFEGMAIPGIILSPMEEIERPVTTRQNDTGHGVGVTIIQISNREKITDLDQLNFWRTLAKATLLNKRIDAASVSRTDLEPRTVVDASAFSNMYDVTSFTARCWVRSP